MSASAAHTKKYVVVSVTLERMLWKEVVVCLWQIVLFMMAYHIMTILYSAVSKQVLSMSYQEQFKLWLKYVAYCDRMGEEYEPFKYNPMLGK